MHSHQNRCESIKLNEGHHQATAQRSLSNSLQPSVARDFSPRANFQHTLLQHFYHSLYVQLHALTYVHMLKITSTGNHTTVWTHKNTANNRSTPEDGMWLPKWQGNRRLSHARFVAPKQVYTSIKSNAAEIASTKKPTLQFLPWLAAHRKLK